MGFEEAIRGTIDKLLTEDDWRPVIFDPSRRADRAAVVRLIEEGRIARVVDSFDEQAGDLERCLHPELDGDEAVAALVAERFGGRASSRQGVWIHFPWRAILVHTLARDDFRRLRLDRNRYKITLEEQEILNRKRIGIVGLSVGHGIAMTLAMEGVGGHLRLTDMDRVGLSNLNRLRAGLVDLGQNKALMAARDVTAIDPFLSVDVYPGGLSDESLETFLTEGGRLDLIIEECDDLYLKVRLRELARAHGIPVVMETSDRGLIDVERFDSQPERPLFHGLAGDLRAESLRGLSTQQKVPVVFKLLGEGISERSAASLVEVGQTISSWPQTASGVGLGAAVVTDTVRRILLGQLHESGRFYVDVEQIVVDGASVDLHECTTLDVEAPTEARSEGVIDPAACPSGHLDDTAIRYLVEHAVCAPSGGNNQPWSFRWRDEGLDALIDEERAASFLDFDRSATWLTFGAVAENLELAAGALGRGMELTMGPLADGPLLAFRATFPAIGKGHPLPELLAQVPRRVTNRRLGERVDLTETAAEALLGAGRSAGAEVILIREGAALAELGSILGEGDKLRFLSKVMHAEMMGEIRWSKKEVLDGRDGLDIATLELSPADVAGMRVISSWPAMRLVGSVGGGSALTKPSRKAVAAASALGLVYTRQANPEAYFQGGRAMQRVWLQATALGLAFQPMTALTYLFGRIERGRGEGLDGNLRKKLIGLRSRYLKVLGMEASVFEAMLFRVARAEPPTARSLRRRVDHVLSFG